MGTVSTFLANFDLSELVYYVMRAAAALVCIVLHEMSHGYAAYALGDQTAKRMGRLSFSPLHHIDPLGLLLMITAGFGWAKPVPVNMNRFKHPKRDMALTALAGPVSNFIIALIALGLASLMYHFLHLSSELGWMVANQVFTFFLYTAILSVGLGVFNLIPVPPLDGSKVLFSFLPDRMYAFILRYEQYVMLLLFALVWMGVLDGPLFTVRTAVLNALFAVVGLPAGIL